ncbi:MAG: 3-dehydroquinate synthase [Burkholderiales bacterium]
MQSLRVELGKRAYPVHIGVGILNDSTLYAAHLRAGRAAIVTNTVIAPLYLERLRRALADANIDTVEIVIADGEQAKNWQTLDRVFDALLAARCDRQTPIIALGGGVVGDLAGFAAAIYQRGVPFVQVPTTLLAQVDSSVGGKTAINHPRGKNMIGAFYQPLVVVSDVATLATLPPRELRAGLAEVIKHGFALDSAFAEWIEGNIERLMAGDADALIVAVRRSCELKAEVVMDDERESGRRVVLNFGHTFAHAIETGVGYGKWLHGEAVAAGMVMAAELSARVGLIGEHDVRRVRKLIARAGLPVTGPAELPPERYLELMAVDKKVAHGRVRFVLLDGVGRAVLRADPGERLVREAINAAAAAATMH